jgi:hypothetical protein
MSDDLKDFLNDINFLEAPLKGLLKVDMTDPEQLRKFVQDTRTMRESRQTFKAMVVEGETKESKPRADIFADFTDNEGGTVV